MQRALIRTCVFAGLPSTAAAPRPGPSSAPPQPRSLGRCPRGLVSLHATGPPRGASPEAEGRALERGRRGAERRRPTPAAPRGVCAAAGPELPPEAPQGAAVAQRGRWPGWGTAPGAPADARRSGFSQP